MGEGSQAIRRREPGNAGRAARCAASQAEGEALRRAALCRSARRLCGKFTKRDSVSAQCLAFTILTASRTAEAIGAQWSEIDLVTAVWTIPAARMKAKRDHRVPLSDQAVELLRGLTDKLASKDFVFINGGGKPLSNMAMSELLKGMVPQERATVHGFRSTFSDWARDQTSYSRDVIEQCLAHTIEDKSEAAYRRGDALDKRRRLMGEWAKFCEAPATITATVSRIGKAR